jgi:hypothetical protein
MKIKLNRHPIVSPSHHDQLIIAYVYRRLFKVGLEAFGRPPLLSSDRGIFSIPCSRDEEIRKTTLLCCGWDDVCYQQKTSKMVIHSRSSQLVAAELFYSTGTYDPDSFLSIDCVYIVHKQYQA